MISKIRDPFLLSVVNELVTKYRCHTVILYGSRARGDATERSDYDLMGVRKVGRQIRVSEKRDGTYLDIFLFSDKNLRNVGESHLYMKGAKVLYDERGFGARFIEKLRIAAKKPYRQLPGDELQTRKVWAQKMLDRAEVGDVEGLYRRSWLHQALLSDYFILRKRRYDGSKASFAWLKKNDRTTYRLFGSALKNPDDFKLLRKLVLQVTEVEF